jgi:hypothetical protein
MGANTFLRNIFAAAYPLFGLQMYDNLGFHWANTLLALLTVAMVSRAPVTPHHPPVAPCR